MLLLGLNIGILHALFQAQLEELLKVHAIRDHDLQQELLGIDLGSCAVTIGLTSQYPIEALEMERDDVLGAEAAIDELLAQQRHPIEIFLTTSLKIRGEDLFVRVWHAEGLASFAGILEVIRCHGLLLQLDLCWAFR